MKKEILNFVNENTNANQMEDVSTKDVAKQFGITTKEAYKILNQLEQAGEIQKINSEDNKFEFCGWLENHND